MSARKLRPLSPNMLRELETIKRTGDSTDLYEWLSVPSSLAFHAREQVLSALFRRDLIAPEVGGYALTDRGRAVLELARLRAAEVKE